MSESQFDRTLKALDEIHRLREEINRLRELLKKCQPWVASPYQHAAARQLCDKIKKELDNE